VATAEAPGAYAYVGGEYQCELGAKGSVALNAVRAGLEALKAKDVEANGGDRAGLVTATLPTGRAVTVRLRGGAGTAERPATRVVIRVGTAGEEEESRAVHGAAVKALGATPMP
jgi:hypothetical protein